ncbi:hypothetical protein ABB07_38070 [Streptomyces incarnatus]|uniref:Uncharacterized protein n=1 Tax=Streptomyces incarnatus TaxID=665007 RepID=A0ABN4GTR9_9ACTN|nr:hypothetical protein ABB07_38070 [Streptomyces incarnatus]
MECDLDPGRLIRLWDHTELTVQGARARDLVDGARVLKIFGEYVPGQGAVAEVPHFSAHADVGQIIGWLCGAPAPRTT